MSLQRSPFIIRSLLVRGERPWTPLIHFPNRKAGELSNHDSSSNIPKSLTIDNFFKIPENYKPKKLTDAEMEAIESGGASFF
eukprot:TRINITY_DN249_c3_g1_i3.p1 TRINITY_DN249_c3_g1~~TRINITY_DN249_c3_g1_i3.p1  ORF type:complete len:82 (-),score=6.99 TRINITY_DN249_c3_g1_i3:158-403(-)